MVEERAGKGSAEGLIFFAWIYCRHKNVSNIKKKHLWEFATGTSDKDFFFSIFLTDLEAMGIPVSSTGPIPENFISLSSLVGVQLRGKVATFWTALDSGADTQYHENLCRYGGINLRVETKFKS